MKKIALSFVLVLLVFFMQACAMAPMAGNVSFDDPLYFNELTMTFTNTSQDDILYQVGNPADDFILLYRLHADTPNSEDEAVYFTFMSTLYQLSISQNMSMGQLFNLSSSELKDKFDQASIPFSINDVVTFNTIKTEIDFYKQNQSSLRVSKSAYIEYRLSIDLSNDAYQSLVYFQSFFNEFKYDNSSFYIRDYDFETFLSMAETSQSFSEDESLKLETAYGLIKAILELN